VQDRRGIALLLEPRFECDAIERSPLRIRRGQCNGNGEHPLAVIAAHVLQRLDALAKALLLGAFQRGDALCRQIAFLPLAVEVHTRFRRMHESGLIIFGTRRQRIAGKHAKVCEDLAYVHRFLRW